MYLECISAAFRLHIGCFGCHSAAHRLHIGCLGCHSAAPQLLFGCISAAFAPLRLHLQVSRDGETCEALGLRGLFPAGEGAGYAGGIVSAAVDGIRVAKALLPVLAAGVAAGVASGAPSGAAEEEAGQR